jgi:hypothetical protein
MMLHVRVLVIENLVGFYLLLSRRWMKREMNGSYMLCMPFYRLTRVSGEVVEREMGA